MVINIMSQQKIMNFILLLCCVLAPIFAEDCTVEQYKCEVSGKCIGIDKICDGIKDCDNNEDEEECYKHSKLIKF